MNRIVQFFHKTVSPEYFYWLSGKLIPWFIGIFLLLLLLVKLITSTLRMFTLI